MSFTPIEQFNRQECDLLDARKVNAFIGLTLDPENPTGIILDTSWGTVELDLKDIVKAGETVTSLELYPADNPTMIRFHREDGEMDCITGEELSRIVYLRYLADVEQGHDLANGEILMYDTASDLFKYYDLLTFVNTTNADIANLKADYTALLSRMSAAETNIINHGERLTNLESRMSTAESSISTLQLAVSTLQSDVSGLNSRLAAIEGAIFNWSSDKTTKIARGNINVYGDINNTGSHSNGIFTHSTSSNVTNDLYFS